MKKIAFAGSFDPITNGHLWVIEEGLQIADEVLLFIAYNPNKKALFTIEEKQKMIVQSLEEKNILSKVKVIVLKNEYAAYSALEHGCEYSLRGLRSAADFDYESLIQQTNRDVLMGTKTLFVMPPHDLESVSSSFIKSLIGPIGWHWNIKNFVSTPVYMALLNKYVTKIVYEFMNLSCSNEQKDNFIKQIFNNYNYGRYYHNMDHIVHFFQELEWAIINYNIPKEIYQDVALALATHDIIYGAKDKISDEELSANWLKKFLNSLGLENEQAISLVKSTEHLSGKYVIKTEQEKLMNSIDLAILAKNDKIYTNYMDGIRKEYSFISDDIFYPAICNAPSFRSGM